MKKFLTKLPWIIINGTGFSIITIMDIVLILMMLCIKATRLILMRLSVMFDFDDQPMTFKENKVINNAIVNVGYKYYIDLMYPEVEEDDEYEEDEDES